jgi:CheY-like chemotaxis protein
MNGSSIIDPSVFGYQTILLVDDNEDDVFITQSGFRKAGVPNPLQIVNDGEQAIAYLRGDDAFADREKFPLPVIVLLDLNMPKKGGLEVLEWIRANPSLKRMTVHILTASSRAVDVARAFDLGANSYIVKPSKMESLVEMIGAWHTMARFTAYPNPPS